jgi:hypothetical protein
LIEEIDQGRLIERDHLWPQKKPQPKMIGRGFQCRILPKDDPQDDP